MAGFRRGLIVVACLGGIALFSAACGEPEPIEEPIAEQVAQPPAEPTESPAQPTETSQPDPAPVFGDEFPEVLAVQASPGAGTSWAFNVTLSSPYDTPERYADAWRVLDDDGRELGIRILGHDHANEQPFTRSATIDIPEGTATVWVEGRDQANGWSGQRFEVSLAAS